MLTQVGIIPRSSDRKPDMNTQKAVLLSLISVAGAAAVGTGFSPGRGRQNVWYASLRKPPYTPPGPAIGIVWTVLETLLCVAGTRLLMKPRTPARTTALTGWYGTLAGLAGHSYVFFGRRNLAGSTAVAGAMCVAASTAAASATRIDKAAAASMAPLVLWTAFAVVLAEDIRRTNV